MPGVEKKYIAVPTTFLSTRGRRMTGEITWARILNNLFSNSEVEQI